jgi:hypothetical protein
MSSLCLSVHCSLFGRYTHYWRGIDNTVWTAAWPQLVKDAKRIVDDVDIRVTSEITDELIFVDGGHEAFELRASLGRFDFCKTARKPYDDIVTAILLRAYYLTDGKGIEVRCVVPS